MDRMLLFEPISANNVRSKINKIHQFVAKKKKTYLGPEQCIQRHL
jgi:hypothetical protein